MCTITPSNSLHNNTCTSPEPHPSDPESLQKRDIYSHKYSLLWFHYSPLLRLRGTTTDEIIRNQITRSDITCCWTLPFVFSETRWKALFEAFVPISAVDQVMLADRLFSSIGSLCKFHYFQFISEEQRFVGAIANYFVAEGGAQSSKHCWEVATGIWNLMIAFQIYRMHLERLQHSTFTLIT